ncbi:MAG: recombination protein NinG [Halioglobus sp.]|nr:recombination protein NinG [Halioglobus sp.]
MPRLKSCKAPGCSVRKPRDELLGPMREFCSIRCGFSLADHRQRQAAERRRQKESRELRKRKEALKSRGDWMREAQAAFNSYIRARDYGKPCISSGRMMNDSDLLTGSRMDAGHYRSTGAAPHLRFNTFNCHGQSVKDNRDLSGNAVEYRKGLIARIGLERVERLENDNRIRSFSIHYLRRAKAIFSRRARHIKKLRGVE